MRDNHPAPAPRLPGRGRGLVRLLRGKAQRFQPGRLFFTGRPLGGDHDLRFTLGAFVALGVDSQTTTRRYDIQHQSTSRVDEARDSYSGVNIDEEMVAMVQFQHAYDAAARFMTTIDQMLDTLVNRTGIVGR